MTDPLKTTVTSIYKTTNEKVMSMRHACLGHCEQDELGFCVYNYKLIKINTRDRWTTVRVVDHYMCDV
jgi:hypothetical protein